MSGYSTKIVRLGQDADAAAACTIVASIPPFLLRIDWLHVLGLLSRHRDNRRHVGRGLARGRDLRLRRLDHRNRTPLLLLLGLLERSLLGDLSRRVLGLHFPCLGGFFILVCLFLWSHVLDVVALL